jgi:dihydroorotate dehydrogenase
LPQPLVCGSYGDRMPALDKLAMALLRRLPPGRAHALALTGLRLGLGRHLPGPDDPMLGQRVLGIDFANPIGLAAGLDKDAVAIAPLMALGFGFVEAGTVTLRPQPGNPTPRLFRLHADRGLINRMGFNGGGIDRFLGRLAAPAKPYAAPLGINVGLNKENADPERDYPALVAAVAPFADYIAINVSSPNTPGLRDLQAAGRLQAILRCVGDAVPSRPPLLIKIAPDLTEPELEAVIEACVSAHADGLIVGNTTLERPTGLRSPNAREAGGLSGAPLFARSTALLAKAHAIAGGRLVLIGCGGIFSGRDALAKIRAGAHLVQLYTAFAYEGPALIPRLKSELAAALRADGIARIADAIGVDAPRLVKQAACNT